MCGIAGIFHTGGSPPVEAGPLDAMRQSMAHRGPDGEGLWISADKRVGLAHKRLSIIDLTDAAGQPMANETGSVRVTFNGEIYNHLELRDALNAAGHVFATDHADTEVLVHGYEEWGIDGLVERLEGMFAFAIWDAERARLTVVRDRVGVKPVYFTETTGVDGGRFLFASEIKGLLAHPAVGAAVAPAAMYHYLTYLTTPAPLTMFDGIYKLPAATILEIEAGGLTARRYWDAVPGGGVDAAEIKGLSDEALADYYINGIRERLEAAVEKRMMSDAPYGAFLSGGIDSSVNVALMSRFTDKPVNTFTVGFSDHERLNELQYADRVAKLFNTNHHEVRVAEADMTGYLGDLIHTQDEPLADWVCIPLYFVAKLAADTGVKVIQVGEGADEQFCGYRGYMKYLQLERNCFRPFQRLPGPLRRGAAALAASVAQFRPAFGQYADAVERAAENREAFWSGAVSFWESQKKPLLPGFKPSPPSGADALIDAGLLTAGYLVPDSYNVAESFLAPFDAAWPGRDQLTRMIHNEFRLRLPELLLMRVDKITMSTSLEARVPFLDHDLVEFTMDIPEAAKIKGGETKHLLKKAVAGMIPDDIIYRPKMGFGAPMAEWLKGDFGSVAASEILGSDLLDAAGFDKSHIAAMIADHRAGARDAALHIWTLYNLTAWHDHWIAG